MQVQRLRAINKSRFQVLLDNGVAFVLYKGEINRFKIREDDILSDAVYKAIMEEILPKRCRLRGLNLIAARPYTTYKLKEKLTEGGYPESIITDAIDYFKSIGVLDDYRYAVNYITLNSSRKSKKRIATDLTVKGIDKDIVKNALDEVISDGDATDETEVIKRLAKKRHFDPETATYEERQKLIAYLYNKGFEYDKIVNSIKE